jgi:hypothetical protein
MIPRKKLVACKRCGAAAILEVVPDGSDDAPRSFAITWTCSAGCQKTYWPVSATKMHELIRLPLAGWNLGEERAGAFVLDQSAGHRACPFLLPGGVRFC